MSICVDPTFRDTTVASVDAIMSLALFVRSPSIANDETNRGSARATDPILVRAWTTKSTMHFAALHYDDLLRKLAN
jgi:hypothetical protein